MIKIRFAALPFVLLLCSTISYGQEISQHGTATGNVVSSIGQVDFKNFTFSRQTGTEAIQFRDGKYVGADDLNYYLMRITYGDLTGDGNEEAIILLRGCIVLRGKNTSATPTLDEVFIYTLKNGRAVLLTNFEGGKRGEYILSIGSLGSNFKVEAQLLIIDQSVYKDDYEYAPRHYYTIKYRWDGSRMVEAETSALKPLPENMQEIG